jgi:hypothetical protein
MKFQKVIIAVCFVRVSTIFSEIPITIDEKMWVPNNDIGVIAHTADKIYIGGGFNYVGPVTGGGAVVDTVNGQLRPDLPIIAHSCNAVEPDGKGGWYIGGILNRIDNVTRKNLVHILPDNSIDTLWNPKIDNNYVSTLLLYGSKLYVGGSFTSIGGKKRNHIACLDAATGAVADWNPNASSSTYPSLCVVSTIKIYGPNVYVGGVFDSIGGQKRLHLACLDTIIGQATDWNPGANEKVQTFTLHEGYLYAGGLFTTIGGKPIGHLARIEINTGTVSDWNPNAKYFRFPSDCSINSIVALGKNIYVGGKFDTIGGKVRRYIACLDSITGQATDWDPNANKPVYSIYLKGTKLYAGGDFDTIGGIERNFVACLNINTGIPTAWNPSGSRTVYAISQFGNAVFLAGNGTAMNTVKRRFAACIDKKTKKATSWNPDLNGRVNALVVAGAKIYIGGSFDTIGEKNRNHVACVDTISGKVTDWDPKISWFYSRVDAIVPHRGKIYLGGAFDSAGGQRRRSLAACDSVTGALSDWNPNPIPDNSSITALSIVDDKVYVSGSFNNIGGANRNKIACLDTFTGAALPWNPNITGSSLNTFSIYGSKVYLGGLYSKVGETQREGISCIDIGTGLTDNWNPILGKNSSVDKLIPFQSKIFYCGSFYSVGDCTGDRIGYFDAINGDVVNWNICIEGGSINTFAIDTNNTDLTDLYVGGSYYTINGRSHFNFTHFYNDKTKTHNEKPITKIEKKSGMPTIKISNQQCRIHYSLLSTARVQITLYDLQGKIISTVTNTIQPAGVYSASIVTASLAPGLYLINTRIGEFNKIHSFTIVK